MPDCNVPNRTIFCKDNLDVMQGINSNCIDLIYLDPPFNKNKKFTAPIGSSAEGAEFSDIFREEDVKGEWLVAIREDQPELYHYLTGIKGVGNPYNFAYLAYMAIRLIECHRILKDTGSIYLHCDPTMSHYLKVLLDCILGEDNFRNEIVWQRTITRKGNLTRGLAKDSDVVLRYSKSDDFLWKTEAVTIPYDFSNLDTKTKNKYCHTDFAGRRYQLTSITAPTQSKESKLTYEVMGITRTWRWSKKRMEREIANGRVVQTKTGNVPRQIRYLDEQKGKTLNNVWIDIPAINSQAKERTGYPTQKPLALLERIIQASSNTGDMILDPFCGCATTCVAAEHLQRQWIGVDISITAYDLVNKRLTREAADPNDMLKYQNTIHLKTDPPKRTDQGVDYRERKFVYVISHPEYPGEYKVGIAKNWKSRLNSYQTSDPDRRYKVEFTHLTPYFRETEKHIHHLFPNKHEWVQGDLKEIADKIKGYGNDQEA